MLQTLSNAIQRRMTLSATIPYACSIIANEKRSTTQVTRTRRLRPAQTCGKLRVAVRLMLMAMVRAIMKQNPAACSGSRELLAGGRRRLAANDDPWKIVGDGCEDATCWKQKKTGSKATGTSWLQRRVRWRLRCRCCCCRCCCCCCCCW